MSRSSRPAPAERKVSPDTVIERRRSSVAALDGSLSAHALSLRHPSPGHDTPAAPLAHRPSMMRLTKRSPPTAPEAAPLGAMDGFNTMLRDTESMERREERRRRSYTQRRPDAIAPPTDFDEEKNDSEAARRKKASLSPQPAAPIPVRAATALRPQPLLVSPSTPSSLFSEQFPVRPGLFEVPAGTITFSPELRGHTNHHALAAAHSRQQSLVPSGAASPRRDYQSSGAATPRALDILRATSGPHSRAQSAATSPRALDIEDEEQKSDHESKGRPSMQLLAVTEQARSYALTSSSASGSASGSARGSSAAGSRAASVRGTPEVSPMGATTPARGSFSFATHSSTHAVSGGYGMPVPTPPRTPSKPRTLTNPPALLTAVHHNPSSSQPSSTASSPKLRTQSTIVGANGNTASYPTRPGPLQLASSPTTPSKPIPTERYASAFVLEPFAQAAYTAPPTPSSSASSSLGSLRGYPLASPTSSSAGSSAPATARARAKRNVAFPDGADLVRVDQWAPSRARMHNRHGVKPILHNSPASTRSSSPYAYHHHGGMMHPLISSADRVARYASTLAIEASCVRSVKLGGSLVKYNSSGKPQRRWFYVQEDEDEWKLHWEAIGGTNRPGLDLESSPTSGRSSGSSTPQHRKNQSSSSLLPFFQIGKWKFNPDRARSLVDVTQIHYGPFYSAGFCSLLDQMASSSVSATSSKPWLCFSVQFPDRVIDLCCSDEAEVTRWFLGLQALAPLSVFHMSRGMLLWQRLVMKLNFHGLAYVRARVFASDPGYHLLRTRASSTSLNGAPHFGRAISLPQTHHRHAPTKRTIVIDAH